jgi:hypothetical protein
MNMASNTHLRLTTQVGHAHAATGVLLDLGTNSQPHKLENAAEHTTRVSLTCTGQAGETTCQTGLCWWNLATSTEQLYTGQAGETHWLDRSKPESPKTPNRPTGLQTDPNSKQQQHGTTANSLKRSPEQKPNWGLQRPDRWEALVRSVWPELVRMNITRGSTPPNPNPDLPSRSTDLRKTLGIVGTPHRESIAKFMSTKTCQNKRNRRNPAKNSSNPRAPKTPKPSLLTHGFGRGIKGKRTTKGSHIHPLPNP